MGLSYGRQWKKLVGRNFIIDIDVIDVFEHMERNARERERERGMN